MKPAECDCLACTGSSPRAGCLDLCWPQQRGTTAVTGWHAAWPDRQPERCTWGSHHPLLSGTSALCSGRLRTHSAQHFCHSRRFARHQRRVGGLAVWASVCLSEWNNRLAKVCCLKLPGCEGPVIVIQSHHCICFLFVCCTCRGPFCWEPRTDRCSPFKAWSMSEYNHACLTHCQKFLTWPNFYHPGPLCFLPQELPLLAFCASGSSAVCVLCLRKFCMCFVPQEVLLYVFCASWSSVCVLCLRKFYCMCFLPQEVLLCVFCASGSATVYVLCLRKF